MNLTKEKILRLIEEISPEQLELIKAKIDIRLEIYKELRQPNSLFLSVANYFTRFPRRHIAIVGPSKTPESEIYLTARNLGVPQNNLWLLGDYTGNKNIIHKLSSENYPVILLGPVHHKLIKIKGNLLDFFSKKGILCQYIRCYNGDIKITKESLSKTMNSILPRLVAMG